MKSNKSFFIISFLPALAYWYLEENYSVRIAVFGGLGLAILEVLAEKIFFKKVHQISLLNFFLILFLSLLSIMGDEGIWFRLQPAITGVFIGGFLLFKVKFSGGLFRPMMIEMGQKPLPEVLMLPMERDCAFLFFFYGLWMFYVAFSLNTDQWLFYKTVGFYIAFGVFLVLEFILMRFRLKRL